MASTTAFARTAKRPAFAWNVTAVTRPASTHRLAGLRVQQQPRARALDQLEQREAHRLGVVGHRVAHAVRRASPHQARSERSRSTGASSARPHSPARGKKRGAARGEPLGDLLAEPADHLPPAAVVEREQQDDQAAGREPAERVAALDQQHVGARARRGDRGRDARGAAADHQHVGLVADGRAPRGLVDEGGAAHPAEGRTALRLAQADRFDVVAVGVDEERRVVGRAVVGAQARRAVVAAARLRGRRL